MAFKKLTGTGTGSAYLAADYWGYQTAEEVRNDLNLLAAGFGRKGVSLGGSNAVGLMASVQVNAEGYLDVIVDNTGSVISGTAGVVVQVRVKCRTDDATVSITPKLLNLTDSTIAGLGAACSATAADFSGANQDQTFSVTLAAGVKTYRLVGLPSAATFQVWFFGVLDIYLP